ncbi:GGDEF domain-containing protein [Pseudoalteromonas xiamenensis]
MINSISKKLTALFICCALLVTVTSIALWNIGFEQTSAKQQFENITNIHKGVDLLRSQLWTFLQFGDRKSLQRVKTAQLDLEQLLQKYSLSTSNLKTLRRLNENLAQLVNHEQSLIIKDVIDSQSSKLFVDARLLLHARYNILMEEMAETLIYEQRQLVRVSAQEQNRSLWKTSLLLVTFTLILSLIALIILKRFRHGFAVISDGIDKLAKGDLVSRLSSPSRDEEFVELIDVFNQMKASLQKSTVTKEELEREVQKQTALLQEQKERLRFLSERDPLTGIYNRRAFNAQLDQTVARASRAELSLAVLFFDLDKFKEINDNKGHQAGDEILVQIAKRLQNNIRRSDFCGRFGGDEFIVCLNLEKDYSGVLTKSQELVEALSQPIHYCNELIRVDVSIGISLYPKEAQDPETLIKLADEAMYQAKEVEGTHCFCKALSPSPKRKVQ